MSSEKNEFLGVVSPDHLGALLQTAGVDIKEWGVGKAKSLKDFFEEIQEGETVLVKENGELRRQVSVATIDVFYTNESGETVKLVEMKQVWHDGTGRERARIMKQSLSEKLKIGEDPGDAIVRGLREELKIVLSRERVAPLELGVSTEASPSYPGLMCQYKYFPYETTLSKENFKPEGYVDDDGKKFTYFEWFEVEKS